MRSYIRICTKSIVGGLIGFMTSPAYGVEILNFDSTRVEGRFIVSYDGDPQVLESLTEDGFRIVEHFKSSHAVLVERGQEIAVMEEQDAAMMISEQSGVVSVEADAYLQIFEDVESVTPNDPRFGDLWGLESPQGFDINARKAWGATTGSIRTRLHGGRGRSCYAPGEGVSFRVWNLGPRVGSASDLGR